MATLWVAASFQLANSDPRDRRITNATFLNMEAGRKDYRDGKEEKWRETGGIGLPWRETWRRKCSALPGGSAVRIKNLAE
jgi:hypothetical protein